MKDENLYLLRFAWKSIHRHLGRSFFIGFSVSLAVVIAVWVVAFFDGMNAQIERAVVDNNTGFYQLQETHYAKSADSGFPLKFDEKNFQDKPLTAISPELVLDANISAPEGSAALSIIGMVHELHEKLLPLGKDPGDGALIGQELADLFHYNIGDQLVVNYQDTNGELSSELITITGIYNINSKSFQKRFVYIPQSLWQQLYFHEVRPGVWYNRLVINVSTLEEGSFLYRYESPEIKVRSWKELNPEMAVVLDFHDGMIRFFFLIIATTILMTILTPVQMLWQERLKELRMMNILGVTKRVFWKLGIFEIIQMIVGSFALSLIALLLIIGIQSKTGIDFRFLNDTGLVVERAGIKLPGIIYPLLAWHQVVMTFFFVMFVLSASYLWSIHRTLKKMEAIV